ncbi:MAG TPA: FAD:protein FMN transferase [Salinivirgaceae bacterium]|nr:FAD:protein FMN transferase [Salinivirgaceae bacterium]
MRNIVVLILAITLLSCSQSRETWQHNKGMAHGTFYNITYLFKVDLQKDIEQIINQTDQSLSTFSPTSIISRLNNDEDTVVLDSLFIQVFDKGKEIWEATSGAFDMTVAPLVNAWGFGYDKGFEDPQKSIDSIMNFVGFEKISRSGTSIIKKHSGIKLDASAIAKGFSVDRVGQFLESQGVTRYMVEIGGEVRVKGSNPDNLKWKIGIDKPADSHIVSNDRELQTILHLNHGSIATSGNYRQFYIKDGKRYAHTIDPKTGYPVQQDLLSVTVWAPDCMTADAYATAFMVLGYEASLQIVDNTDSLEAYFIVGNNAQQYDVFYTKGIEAMLK